MASCNKIAFLRRIDLDLEPWCKLYTALMRSTTLCVACLLVCAVSGAATTNPTTMPKPKPSAVASCALSPAELAARRQKLIPGLFKRAKKVEDIPNGLRFTFAGKPGLLADLAKIMDQERDCCSFLRISVTAEPREGPVTFEVTGPKGTAEMLRKL